MKELLNLQLMMFLLILIGLILKKTKIVGKTGQKNITDMVIDLILPCNIVVSFMIDFSVKILKNFAVILIISLVLQIFCVILGGVLYRKCSPGRRKCLRYATICSNAGFLGNPIAQGIYGNMGLTLASIYLIPQRIMMWSEGVSVFTEAPSKKEMLKKIFTHPCIIACEIGIILMLTGIRPPEFLDRTIVSVSNCNTAMSMLVIGMILADADFRSLVDKDVLFYSVIRLLVIPFLVWLPCYLLRVDRLVTGVSVILAAMPAGATTSILASKYECDGEFAVKLVVFSTAVSLITTPLWSMFLHSVL
ncbi:MAG: AEC family transporter [Lachnospiraceae bacterium]|nr:AEC family transporter [Lachnospiraceae bacterium]